MPLLLLLAVLSAPVPEVKAKLTELAALERKLHGEWQGQGGCIGDIAFHPNGKYRRTKQGPDGADSEGTWVIRWDALPPTLVLTCKTASDPNLVGKREMKLILLEDDAFAYQYPKSSPIRYKRVEK